MTVHHRGLIVVLSLGGIVSCGDAERLHSPSQNGPRSFQLFALPARDLQFAWTLGPLTSEQVPEFVLTVTHGASLEELRNRVRQAAGEAGF